MEELVWGAGGEEVMRCGTARCEGLNGWICSELESSAEQWRDCLGSACR